MGVDEMGDLQQCALYWTASNLILKRERELNKHCINVKKQLSFLMNCFKCAKEFETYSLEKNKDLPELNHLR